LSAVAPRTCNAFDISGFIMSFDDNEETFINVPAGNISGGFYDNRSSGNSVNDIVCSETSTVITPLACN